MRILPVEAGPVSTIGYLVFDEDSKEGVIIDTPLESTNYFTGEIASQGIYLKHILLTHSHWDHTADAPELKRKTDSTILIHQNDEYRVKAPNENTIWELPFKLEAFSADNHLSDGTKIKIGKYEVETLFTPGQTEGGVSFVCHSEKVVFTGDTIFNMSIGRVDLPGGNFDQLLGSIRHKLMTLPDDYSLLCGHGDPSTVGFEKSNNPYLNE